MTKLLEDHQPWFVDYKNIEVNFRQAWSISIHLHRYQAVDIEEVSGFVESNDEIKRYHFVYFLVTDVILILTEKLSKFHN